MDEFEVFDEVSFSKERLTTCDIADGMLLNGIDDGGVLPGVDGIPGNGSEYLIFGPAYTVEFAPKSDPRPAVSSHYIDSVPDKSVVLIATSPECQLDKLPYTKVKQSLYGGLMSNRAKYLGAEATVVLGNIRDIDEHNHIGHSVFSYGINPCAANNVMKVVSVNKPLQVSPNRIVNPGDIVYADKNGVLVVPAGLEDEVLKAAKLRWKANILTTKDIELGKECQASQKERRKEYC